MTARNVAVGAASCGAAGLPMNSPFLLLCLGVIATASVSAADQAAESTWVRRGPDGKLVYRVDARGEGIPDFSRAGYGGGGVGLPQVPTVVTLQPQPAGDDGARIQAALDEVGARTPDARGFRGAVLLAAGTYRIGGKLEMKAGGVVLRGASAGETGGTVILATGKTQRTLIEIGGPRAARTEIAGTRRRVTDAYVPSNSRSFNVDSAAGYAVGDRIIVYRPSTAAWIAAIGMDKIPNRPGAPAGETKSWKAGDYDLAFERTVTAIAGNRVTVDAPVMNALDAEFGGGAIFKYRLPRIAECGVESLRLVSEYEKGRETEDEAHAWVGIELGYVENAWVRDVTVVHFSHAVDADRESIFVTLQDCRHLEPVSRLTGGRRYSFALNGQYGLALRCFARGARHSFVNGSRARGPSAFVDCTAVDAKADSGPHHRWVVGTLYDNVSDDNQLRVQNRLWSGSGHGWAGAQQVLWNSTSKSLTLQQPPTARNYAIGCIGTWVPGSWSTDSPDGTIESKGRPVLPRSLYRAQLEDRLGPAALAALAPP